jgi:hypothetical protein
LSAPGTCRSRTIFPVLAAATLVIAGFSALLAASRSYVWARPAADEPYNLMVEGFRSGRVWIAEEAPAQLAKAANPYAFATYRPYLKPPWNLTDLSYYRGHLYAYFGVTPAVILFWPYRALTGGWLHQSFAVLAFCVLGYALSVGLAVAGWRRYFPRVGPLAGPVIALFLGSVTTLPVFLVRPGLYEVSISCAFALTMLSLVALWNWWHRPRGKTGWLALASLAYGLAIGARPSLLFGASVLLLPVATSFRAALRDRVRVPWLRYLGAALLPISAVGAGLAAYNCARFGDPLQFGHDYQLSGNNVYGTKSFDPRFFWGNFRLYFLEPLRWHGTFPFVWGPVCPPLAPGHLPVEFFFGALTNMPVLLCAALVPLPWIAIRRGSDGGGGPVGFSAALLILFLAGAIPICFYAGATGRYLLDFVPALALLSLSGLLGLERSFDGGLATHAPPGSPILRAAILGALAYSVAVVWLLAVALGSFYRGAEQGVSDLNSGRIKEGIACYERLCRINPDFRGQAELLIGAALLARGRPGEAIGYLDTAVHEQPDLEAAHFNMGRALLDEGRLREAAESFRRAAALDPLDGEAEAGLGVALFRAGRTDEGIEHEKAAMRIDPTLEDARANLKAFEEFERPSAKP